MISVHSLPVALFPYPSALGEILAVNFGKCKQQLVEGEKRGHPFDAAICSCWPSDLVQLPPRIC